MSYTMMPVFTADAICDIFNVQCEKEENKIDQFELCDIFWPEDFSNDSYKRLSLEEDQYAYSDKEHLRNRIRAAIKLFYPNFDAILIDVSW